jgi:hypothetical protein
MDLTTRHNLSPKPNYYQTAPGPKPEIFMVGKHRRISRQQINNQGFNYHTQPLTKIKQP